MQIVEFNGWKNCVRLANREVELIVTTAVGPRIMRFGFIGGRNLFAEIKGQQGKSGEKKWMIRGGHRLWISPEIPRITSELDNEPVAFRPIPGGVRTIQKPGCFTGIAKMMDITLSPGSNSVRVVHTLSNKGRKTFEIAPWTLTVLAPGGKAVIPLPSKAGHGLSALLPNQAWTLWPYTHLGDKRWTIGAKYLLFAQDRRLGPNKLGIACRAGWAAYLLGPFAFVKRFEWREGAAYPDGGMNFETFSNQEFLELESLGPLLKLAPGRSVTHVERWSLHRGVPACRTDADADRHIRPLAQ